jgi:hypothetical protein
MHLDLHALGEIAHSNPLSITLGIGRLLGDASAKESQKTRDWDDILRAIAELQKVGIHYGIHKEEQGGPI